MHALASQVLGLWIHAVMPGVEPQFFKNSFCSGTGASSLWVKEKSHEENLQVVTCVRMRLTGYTEC